LSQAERSHALQAMRDGRARICVATDVAARGIDLPKLDLVIHAELPSNHERLLHRSGRTGRAGRKGTSVLIVPPNALRKAERVLKTAKLTALWGVAPTADEVLVKDHERILKDDVWTRNVNSVHEHMVPKLLELYGAERVAAAFLETYTEKLSAPEDVVEFQEDPKRKPKKSHEDFGDSVWLRMGKGQRDGLSPGQVVPMICKSGDITNKDIGAIRIQSDHTFIELRKLCVKGFFKSIGPDESVEGAKIIQLTEVPNIPPQAKGRNNERPKRRLPDGEPKRKSSFKSTIDKEKKARPERNKPERQGKSTAGQDKKSHQKHAKNVQEGDGLKFKKKDGKSKGTGTLKPVEKEKSKLRKGASDPSIPMRAPKVGKHNSKKNKARRAQALLKAQGKESPASKRR
jgi:ATP-dependent RNA helicase DeaD